MEARLDKVPYMIIVGEKEFVDEKEAPKVSAEEVKAEDSEQPANVEENASEGGQANAITDENNEQPVEEQANAENAGENALDADKETENTDDSNLVVAPVILSEEENKETEETEWISKRILELIQEGKDASAAKIQAEAEYNVEKEL